MYFYEMRINKVITLHNKIHILMNITIICLGLVRQTSKIFLKAKSEVLIPLLYLKMLLDSHCEHIHFTAMHILPLVIQYRSLSYSFIIMSKKLLWYANISKYNYADFFFKHVRTLFKHANIQTLS